MFSDVLGSKVGWGDGVFKTITQPFLYAAFVS